MPVWRNVEYSDDARGDSPGPSIGIANDNTRVVRPLMLYVYRDLAQAAQDFLGYARVAGSGGRKYISRTVPHTYPGLTDTNGQPWLHATAIQRIEGIGSRGNRPNGMPDFGRAVLHMQYQSVTYKVFDDSHPVVQFIPAPAALDGSVQLNPLAGLPDEAGLSRYITRIPHPFSRSITIPRALPRWVLLENDLPPKDKDGNNDTKGHPIFEGIAFQEPGILWEYVWWLVPEEAIPFDYISRCIGSTNKFAWDHAYAPNRFPPETMLMEAPIMEPITSALGDRLFNVRFRVRHLPRRSREDDQTQRGVNWLLKWVRFKGSKKSMLDYRQLSSTGEATADKIVHPLDWAGCFRPPA